MFNLDRVGRHLEPQGTFMKHATTMRLGDFSISLAVKDLTASHACYQTLGFRILGGVAAQNWLAPQNGSTTIGLFQGMFERNMLTCNPGWDGACDTLPEFTDMREWQRRLRAAGIETGTAVDETTTRPASFLVTDPDSRPILIDQQVNCP